MISTHESSWFGTGLVLVEPKQDELDSTSDSEGWLMSNWEESNHATKMKHSTKNGNQHHGLPPWCSKLH